MAAFIRSFSYIFHPLLIPVYATLFYFVVTWNYFNGPEVYLVFVQVLILTVLLPISLFYLLRSLGRLKSKMILDRRERKLPLALYALLLLMLTQYSLRGVPLPELYYYFIGILMSNVAALAFVLGGQKASLHMMGVASLTLFLISISAYYNIRFIYLIAVMVICCGFVASSRLQAKAHTSGELMLGTLLGAVPQIGLWFLWLLK
ncbi:hypothetical protein AM493_16340 [Flavobacterium akiainvivens]|uniref:Phosphatidic acid phosphatase type 2/haloperoxidase domain-containing protein n=1 Tax=Flavobacterium akiainvivens TaxID=1202724 RepID=A0A0M8MK26_9FLAO|nr:hypothetical protein [Flavobacterium akiainvivens]KOS07437.1 hypothetical protein AM493_16340 [Flavobacterium akiainvivens]SFQ48144.1 hypothetical protein SAMN05444144_105249 [Flavobacterium akiainvivens]